MPDDVKWTEGPWVARCGFPGVIIPESHVDRPLGGSIYPDRNRDYYAQQICVVNREEFGRGTKEANAQLIAASPCMAKAIDALLRAADGLDEAGLPEEYAALRAALSRALGAL